jgi:hypothetical protein
MQRVDFAHDRTPSPNHGPEQPLAAATRKPKLAKTTTFEELVASRIAAPEPRHGEALPADGSKRVDHTYGVAFPSLVSLLVPKTRSRSCRALVLGDQATENTPS